MTRDEAKFLRRFIEDTMGTVFRVLKKLIALLEDRFPFGPPSNKWVSFQIETQMSWLNLSRSLNWMLDNSSTPWFPTKKAIDPHSRSKLVPEPGEDWKKDTAYTKWAFLTDGRFPVEAIPTLLDRWLKEKDLQSLRILFLELWSEHLDVMERYGARGVLRKLVLMSANSTAVRDALGVQEE